MKADYYQNFDLTNVVTQVNYKMLEKLLIESNYNRDETKFLVDGFRNGFDIGYRGSADVKQRSPNLKFRTGNVTILWNKIMKEVKAKRFAGPFADIPFKNFIQSPVGLVPKDGARIPDLFFICHTLKPAGHSTQKLPIV